MRNFRRFYRTTILVFLIAFLHYTLPQHDVARITDTEISRYDPSWYNAWAYAQIDSGSADFGNRDLRQIFTQRKKTYLLGFIQREEEGTMVYRNEDTGLWGWPPYFKVNSIDVQAEASNYVSTAEDPQWVVIRHYGWRNPFFTILPNVVSIRAVDTPTPLIIPWLNIIFFAVVGFGFLLIRSMWRQFRERKLDPVFEDVSDAYADFEGGVQERRGRFNSWIDTWRSKPRR